MGTDELDRGLEDVVGGGAILHGFGRRRPGSSSARTVEEVAVELLAERKPDRRLATNVR